MERNWPTAQLLAATGSAWLVFIFPLFPGGRFVDGPGRGPDHTAVPNQWGPTSKCTQDSYSSWLWTRPRGPQKRNFSSGSPHPVTCVHGKNQSDLPYPCHRVAPFELIFGVRARFRLSGLVGIFWSYFVVYLGSANSPFYFACPSATFWHILGYHISDERGHP